MRTRLDRWGNSLGLRLPRAVAERAGLREGDSVEVDVEEGAVVVRRAKPRYSLDDLLARAMRTPSEWGDIEDVGRERAWEDE